MLNAITDQSMYELSVKNSAVRLWDHLFGEKTHLRALCLELWRLRPWGLEQTICCNDIQNNESTASTKGESSFSFAYGSLPLTASS